MATTTLAAATLMALTLLLFAATPSAACGCSGGCPCTNPPASGGGGKGNAGKCPIDALKLGVCADVLGGLLNLDQLLDSSSSGCEKCCGLIGGLADLEAAVCLCTAIKANVLGLVGLELPVQLSVLVNRCGKKLPSGFHCSAN